MNNETFKKLKRGILLLFIFIPIFKIEANTNKRLTDLNTMVKNGASSGNPAVTEMLKSLHIYANANDSIQCLLDSRIIKLYGKAIFKSKAIKVTADYIEYSLIKKDGHAMGNIKINGKKIYSAEKYFINE